MVVFKYMLVCGAGVREKAFWSPTIRLQVPALQLTSWTTPGKSLHSFLLWGLNGLMPAKPLQLRLIVFSTQWVSPLILLPCTGNSAKSLRIASSNLISCVFPVSQPPHKIRYFPAFKHWGDENSEVTLLTHCQLADGWAEIWTRTEWVNGCALLLSSILLLKI